MNYPSIANNSKLNEVVDLSKLDNLNEDEVLEVRKQFDDALRTAQHRHDIQAFLEVEAILKERDMTINDLMDMQTEVARLRKQKYSDGKGNLWSGRGKRPAWVVDLVGKDGDIEHLAWQDDNIMPLKGVKKKRVRHSKAIESDSKDDSDVIDFTAATEQEDLVATI